MKRLQDMTITEVVKKIRCFGLSYSDVNNILLDSVQEKRVELANEFYKRLEDKDTNVDISAKMIKYLKEIDQYIDKEKFVLTQWYRLKTSRDPKNYTMVGKEMQTCEKLLINSNSKANIGLIETLPDGKKYVKVISTDIIRGKKVKSKNYKRIKDIDDAIGLEKIIENVKLSDIYRCIFDSQEFAERLIGAVTTNVLIDGEKNLEMTYKYLNEEVIESLMSKKYKKEYNEGLKNTLLQYSDHVNVDKMLLITAYRILDKIEIGKIKNEDIERYKEILEQITSKIENPKSKIKLYDDESEEKFELKDIQKELKNFVGTHYVGRMLRTAIKCEVLENGRELYQFNPLDIECIEFTEKETKQLVENIENVRFLMTYDMVSLELLDYMLETRTEWPSDIINSLYKDKILQQEDILEMYEKKKLNIENIRELKTEYGEEIEEIATEEKLIQKYKQYKNDAENDEAMQELERYALLYKELKIKGKAKEEIGQIGANLIERLNTDFEEKDLQELYKLGVINIDTAIEWGGESTMQEMFFDKTMKPSDVKMLLDNQTIDVNYIKSILKTDKLTEEEKLTLICSTFSSDEQMELRMELIQYLNFNEEQAKKGQNRETSQIRHRSEVGEKRKKYTMDPGARWKLMTLLDEEYTQELTTDGHIIFTLPNLENGTVIVEKMFRKTKEGTKPSYGNATYIMSEEQYISNKSQILEETKRGEKKINRDILLEMKENNEADKVIHSKNWGRSLKQYFGIQESVYSKKQLEEIEKAIQSIEKSRTLE